MSSFSVGLQTVPLMMNMETFVAKKTENTENTLNKRRVDMSGTWRGDVFYILQQ